MAYPNFKKAWKMAARTLGVNGTNFQNLGLVLLVPFATNFKNSQLIDFQSF
jgi:hypothetical protein